jgi:CMP/dCMP kinase
MTRITLSGYPGSGTTTVATMFAAQFDLALISTGSTFRSIAAERGITIEELGKVANTDPIFDIELDRKIRAEVEKHTDCVVEGRLSWMIVPDATLKVRLVAPPDVRATRVMKRSAESFSAMVRREQDERARYQAVYHVDIDKSELYDLTINTNGFAPVQVVEIMRNAIAVQGGW